MPRFSSLTHVPTETRRLLRDRFARFLPTRHSAAIHGPKPVTLPDEGLLHLLLNLSIEFESDLERAGATYTEALPADCSEPSLEELIASGWLRVVWGRLSTPFEIAQAARRAPVETMTAFAVLLAKRYEQVYHLTDAARANADLAGAVKALDCGELTPRDFGCQTPDWVAARLWDRITPSSADRSDMLRIWVDRWRLLDCPSLVPGRVWNEVAANEFREAAIDVLGSDPSLVGWQETRDGFVRQIALAGNQPLSSVEGYVPPVPTTVVERALWFDDYSVQRIAMGTLGEFDDIFGLVRLLLAEVEAEDLAPAPHKIASRLTALAIERPELFLILLFKVRQNPVLLADLVLYPRTAGLACLLVAQWGSPTGAWDRALTERDNQTAKTVAFADAVSIMGSFLQEGSTPPEEAAALLRWLHSSAQAGFIDDLTGSETMLATLRGELIGQSAEILRRMVAFFISIMPKRGLGSPTFAAILDLVGVGQLASDVDPAPIVDAYAYAVDEGDYTLSAHRLGTAGAASLYRLAARSSELRQKFLFPTDIKARLAAGAAAEENPYTLADTIARSIRAHIRVLSRVVVGLQETAPDDLVEALIVAVRAGALAHKEKGRIAAFSPRYEDSISRRSPDRPIAADLGAALGRLAGNRTEQLLLAILETDEPMVLAQLMSFAPGAMRLRIERRITDLTPSEAGDIYSLTEMQARIEELLSAGAVNAAAQYLEVEKGLNTMGNVPGRELARLRTTLHLQFLRGDWAAIVHTPPPAFPSPLDQASAVETIAFYRALAALRRPGGDLQAAEQAFAHLHNRRPDVIAYGMNLFATRISLLLQGDLFALLEGGLALRGREVLAAADQMIGDVRSFGAADTERLVCNKALLLLALGQPDRAIELLTALRADRLRDTIAAYSALALYRMDRASEAAAMLETAERTLGATDVLLAVRAHISNSAPFAGVATTSSDDDRTRNIRLALSDFRLMDPIQQASMLPYQSEAFDNLVIDYLRSAAASVVSLVPMMKSVKIDSSEDDLTALIRELLLARFQFLGWSLADQSKGGFTAKGNPGERDLVIHRDSTALAVIEAVVCNRPVTTEWTRSELKSHFQKLPAYSTCRLFLHLTYAYIENPGSIQPYLEAVAEEAAPPGFTYIGREPIPFTDSRPTGLVARYLGDFGEVKVVFLVLNMGQHRQKQAAKTAAHSNSRKSKSR